MASRLIRKVISTPNAPKAGGPYSQAIVADRTIYVAGQLGMDPKDSKLVGEDIQSQTRQCLTNIKSILEAGESSLEKVVKVTVYLADINDYAEMNKVYSEFFTAAKPARVALQVAHLPKSARVEIDAIGMVGDVVLENTQANLFFGKDLCNFERSCVISRSLDEHCRLNERHVKRTGKPCLHRHAKQNDEKRKYIKL